MGILIDMSTPECDWQRCERLRETRRVPLAGIVPVGRRLVIVSPHPDDEVLSAGGLLADCLAERRRAHVVAVTDGEASHPGSALWTPQILRSARSRERARALAVLGAAPDTLVRMGLPDGAVGAHRAALERGLDDQLDEHDIVVTPWRHDGHPDHEAVTAAVLAVQQRCAFEVWEAPIWMWQWERPSSMRIPWHRARRFFRRRWRGRASRPH